MAAPRRHNARGFTLIETALTVVIVGLGIVAMCQLLATGTVANADSTELTTGMSLARNVREFALKLRFKDPTSENVWGLDAGESATNLATWDDVNDLAGRTFSPPIDGRGQALSGFAEWSQRVTMGSIDRDSLASSTTWPFMVWTDSLMTSRHPYRVTVSVFRRNQKVCELRFYAFDGAR